MIIKKLKKNRACPAKLAERSRGFVILFAVTISAILLSITLGVTNMAFREIKFSTSAQNSNNAFFAADAGLECAMVYEKSTGSVFISPGSPSINCNYIPITANESPLSFWTFTLSGLGNGGQGCAIVTVDKTDVSSDPVTTIISKGYNDGGVGCVPGPNTVERQIELSY